MKCFVFAVLISIMHLPAVAQDATLEINQQVWKPFIEAYNTFDTEKFMSVYSKEIIRVPVDQKIILNFTEYRRNINRENQFNKNYNIKASLAIRFTNRIHAKDMAYETGILKIDLTDNNGKPATIYSRFQVLMKKESGVWKIQYDTDSSESATLTEKDFMKADPMQ
jgi:ketosteroid isomerase-like protein